jgi:hypothetical protein
MSAMDGGRRGRGRIAMLRTTEDLCEMRRWAEMRHARPCREEDRGTLRLALPGQPCAAREVGWDEFEVTFRMSHSLFVYDDSPGASRCFVGTADAAHAFIVETCGQTSAWPH